MEFPAQRVKSFHFPSFGRFQCPDHWLVFTSKFARLPCYTNHLIADEVQQLRTVDHALVYHASREAGTELNALRSFSSIIILPAIPLRPAATWK